MVEDGVKVERTYVTRQTIQVMIQPHATEDATPPDGGPPVRVVFVANTFLPLIGGVEVLSLREAKALQTWGHHVRILTPRLDRRWPRWELMDNVMVRRLGAVYLGNKLRLRFGAQWMLEARLLWVLLRT